MNLPNKLTVARIAMIPIFAVLALVPTVPGFWAALVFAIASFTDVLDGHIARSRGLITNFGKFADPLADKMLVASALVVLLALGRLPAWALIIILCRDFAVDGLRFIAADKGVVIAASVWGKRKTASQMVMVIALLLQGQFNAVAYDVFCAVMIGLAVVLTVYSGVDYLWKGRQYLK